MRFTSVTRHRVAAFTLVELLVVIGIIAVLVAILLPALAKARRSANMVQCASNLRQLDMGVLMYANQNNGILPFTTGGQSVNDGYWRLWNSIGRYPADVPNTAGSVNAVPYTPINRALNTVWVCPFALNERSPFDPNFSYTTYGMNGMIDALFNFTPLGEYNVFHGSPPYGGHAWKITQLKPGKVLLGEVPTSPGGNGSMFYFNFGIDDNAPNGQSNYNVCWPFNYMLSPTLPTMSPNTRPHSNRANFAFADGHVEPFTYEEFWAVDNSLPRHSVFLNRYLDPLSPLQ